MRFIKAIIFLVLVPLGLVGATDIPPVKKTTGIRGNVSSPVSLEAHVQFYNDPMQYAESHYYLVIESDYRFSLDIELQKSGFADFQYGDQSTQIWLEPGKEINISFNGQQFQQSIQFSGANAAANNFLQHFQSAFTDIAQQIEANMAVSDADTYKKFILKLSEERRNFVQNDCSFQDASEEFQLLFSKTENYWTVYQLLRYAFDKPLFDGKWEPLLLPDTYYDFLNRMHVSTSGLLEIEQYKAFLDKYIDYQQLKPENKDLDKLVLAQKLLKGEALWYYQAKEIVSQCRAGKIKEAEPAIASFKKNCQYLPLKNAVENVYFESKGVSCGVAAPNFGLTDINGNMVSLADLKGKVIFLDFYATWCGHCMEEMPNLQRLPAAYKDKDVVFVFISFDKNPISWKNYVQNAGLLGTHLWGESLNRSPVSKMYGVKALPASFLIGKDGVIIQSETGGTSVEELSQLIENQLNTK